MIGIYKITNPEGQVYIGQSKDIDKRFTMYSREGKVTNSFPPKLKESFLRFGIDNHDFEILEECLFEDLNIRERHYQLAYASIDLGLNIQLQRDVKKGIKKEKDPNLMTAKEIVIYLNKSTDTIRRWSNKGKLTRKHIGQSVFYERSEVENLAK